MIDDPVTRSALTVIFIVFLATLVAGAVMYLLIRSGEKMPLPPHRIQMWLAGIIGIGIPLLLLAYALLLSPSARLTPKELHQQQMQKEMEPSHHRE